MQTTLLKNKKKEILHEVPNKNNISDAGQKIAKDWFDAAIKKDVLPLPNDSTEEKKDPSKTERQDKK
jgi:hypothetical protein